MAAVSDSIAATVTVKTGSANADLKTLGRNARETGASFNEAGKSAQAASAKIGNSVQSAEKRIAQIQNKGALALGQLTDPTVLGARNFDSFGKSTTKASGTLKELRGSVSTVTATLGALGAVSTVVGGALFSVFDAQRDLTKATKSSQTTFKDATGEVERFSASAYKIGLSKRAALEAATGFGTLFRGLSFGTKESASFSVSLTKLSSDLASKVGGSAEEAALALRAMFRGEYDPIEKYGVKVSEAATANRALLLGLSATKAELTEQDKTLARLTLAYTQTVDAQGNFSRQQQDVANQQLIAAAQTENLRASLGRLSTPVYAESLSSFNDVVERVESSASKSGASIGGLVGQLTGILSPLSMLGTLVRKPKEGFDDTADAAKTFAMELQAGREGSAEYVGAVEYLKKANADAEAVQKKYNEAIGGQSAVLAQARADTQASIGTIQQMTNALRAEDDARAGLAEGRRSLADAERSLGELRAKGKVDVEKVADAELRVRDASQTTADARLRVADAERKLGDFRRTGSVDAEKVAAAERSVVDATRGVVAARRSLIEAEKEVARLRAGPTEDEAGDASRGVIGAQLALERAQARILAAQQAVNDSRGADTLGATLDLRDAELSLAEATDGLAGAQKAQADLAARGVDGSEALAAAEQQALDAKHGLESATLRQSEAEKAAREARAGDPEYAEKMAALIRDVDAAKRGVEAATRGEDKAAKDLRDARAGDPEFERNLAKANDDVTGARLRLKRAEEELPIATLTAKNAQEEFNAKLNDGTPAAERLAKMANQLGIQYDYVAVAAARAAYNAGLVNSSAGFVNFGSIGSARDVIAGRRAAGGPVSGGSAYVVGEKGPELFVPGLSGTIVPNAGTSSTTVHTSVVLDGEVIARVVSKHQRASSKQGGSVFNR